MYMLLASSEPVEQEDKDEVDEDAEEDMEDGVDDVMSALRRRPVSRSSSTTKRPRSELVTHRDFQPALVAADDGTVSYTLHSFSCCQLTNSSGFLECHNYLFLNLASDTCFLLVLTSQINH